MNILQKNTSFSNLKSVRVEYEGEGLRTLSSQRSRLCSNLMFVSFLTHRGST